MPSWASWIWLAVMLPRGNLSKMVFIQTKRSGNMFMDIQFMFHDIYESRSKGNASKRIANHYTHRKQIRQGKPVIAIEFENTNQREHKDNYGYNLSYAKRDQSVFLCCALFMWVLYPQAQLTAAR